MHHKQTLNEQVEPNFAMAVSDNEIAKLEVRNNKELLTIWLPQLLERATQGESEDQLIKWLATLTMKSTNTTRPLVKGLLMLHRLPRTLAFGERYGMLDRHRLCSLGRQLSGAKLDVLQKIDVDLEEWARPKTSNDTLPLAETFSRYLKKFRILHDPEYQPEKPKEPKASIRTDGNGNYHFLFRLSPLLGRPICASLEKMARQQRGEVVDAFVSLFNGSTPPPATLHLLASPEGIPYLHGSGWLHPQEAEQLRVEKITAVTGLEVSDDYRIPDDIRSFVRGRDGQCRFPGCTADALVCDQDHVIAFREDGSTSPFNLHCLCRHHHNMKTKGQVKVTMNKYGVDTWTMPDGQILTTHPQGPWAAYARELADLLSDDQLHQRRVRTKNADPNSSTEPKPTADPTENAH